MLGDNVRQVCDTCFGQANPKAVWSRGLRKDTSESVLMVSELPCTGVQGHTQEHKQMRVKCAHLWETVNRPPHVNLESGVTLKIQQSSHKGSWTTTPALDQSGQINFFTVQGSFASCTEEY